MSKQPLNSISICASAIQIGRELGNLDYENELDKYMQNIMDSVKYMGDTIYDFQNYLTPNKSESVFLLEDTFKIVKSLLISQLKSYDINLIENIDNIKFCSYQNELIQVLINLLNNSIDELISKDYLKYIFIDIFKENEEIVIQIKDNDGGIPEEIMSSIFDPYFTTKGESTGTGVGLYMTKEIIENKLKGKISVTNTEYIYNNKNYIGALFTIKLLSKDIKF